jgi:glutathione S-transferase
MALTIYGSARSRTMRVLWMAAELGLDYTHVPFGFDDPALKEPGFLRINPMGTIPTIVDGDVTLSESLAINLYLAKKYGSDGATPLYPDTVHEEAEVWRWTLWAQGHLEPWVQRDAFMADIREAAGGHIWAALQPALAKLDHALSETPWLTGDHFNVSDLNVAAILSPSRAQSLDMGRLPYVRTWLDRCYERPAAVAVRRRFQA